jgi:hypothetical protein
VKKMALTSTLSYGGLELHPCARSLTYEFLAGFMRYQRSVKEKLEYLQKFHAILKFMNRIELYEIREMVQKTCGDSAFSEISRIDAEIRLRSEFI